MRSLTLLIPLLLVGCSDFATLKAKAVDHAKAEAARQKALNEQLRH